MDSRQQAQFLFYAATALQAALCVRLLATGLWRSYPRFFAYIAALTIESALLAGEMHLMGAGVIEKWWYPNTWLITRVISSVLEIRAAVEIFRRWATAHRGIGRFGSGLLRLIVIVAVVLAATTTPIDFSHGEWKAKYQAMTVLNRGVHGGVSFFLFCTVLFFFTHGGPVARNLKRHSLTMLVFASANAAGYYAIARNSIMLSSILLPAISILTQLYWMLALTVPGERVAPWDRLSRQEAEGVRDWNRQMEEFTERVRRSWWFLRARGTPLPAPARRAQAEEG